jgi:hypothetical protein
VLLGYRAESAWASVHYLAGLDASADQLDRAGHRHRDNDFDRLSDNWAAKDFVGLELMKGHSRQFDAGGLALARRARWKLRWPGRGPLLTNDCAVVPPMSKSRLIMHWLRKCCTKIFVRRGKREHRIF